MNEHDENDDEVVFDLTKVVYCTTCGQRKTSSSSPSPFSPPRTPNSHRRLRTGLWREEPPTIVGMWFPAWRWECTTCATNQKFLTGTPAESGLAKFNASFVSGTAPAAAYRWRLIAFLKTELGVEDMNQVPAGVREEVAAFHRGEAPLDKARREDLHNDEFEPPAPFLPLRDKPAPVFDDGQRRDSGPEFFLDFVGIPAVDVIAFWDPVTETTTVPFGIGDYVDFKGGPAIGPRSSMWQYLRKLERALQHENARAEDTPIWVWSRDK